MPFPGLFVRAPVMAAKHGMQDLALSALNDHGKSPITSVTAAAASGGGGAASGLLTAATTAASPVFAALPVLGQL